MTDKVYISPERMVLAIEEVRPMFQSGVRRYPLEKGKWYKISKREDIPPSPNGHEFVWVVQYEDDELFKNIPHKPEHFLTVEQWRNSQLNLIGL